MEQGLLLGMLGLCAVEDIRKKRVSMVCLFLFGAVGIVWRLLRGNLTVTNTLLGAAVGFVMLWIGYFTRESIGYGDGFLFVITGIFLGGAKNVELLFLGLLYAALFSLGLLIFRKKKGKQEIPFIPFVFLGYVTILLGANI